VVLTPEGQIYCQEVRRALGELAEAGRRLASRERARPVRLSTVDFLAHELLIPRLPRFQERFPGTELRIETSMRPVELHASEIDAALRVRGKAGPGLASEPIGSVVATPICRPDIAGRLRSMAHLRRETLIEMRGGAEGSWARAMQANGVDAGGLRILSFESYFETLTAAAQGLGVAFGLFPMTTEWVRRRGLAVPFPVRIPIDGGVYLVFRSQDPRRALLTEIAGWIREEHAALRPLREGRLMPTTR
jgi:LysR family transcriptional regulator, glycine cleavage system transcriptional activator